MSNYLFGNTGVIVILIEYENKQVKRYFTDYALMQRKTEHTVIIKKRMDSLKASVCFNDFLRLGLGKPHLLYGSLANCYGICITDNVRLIVQPVCQDLSPQSLKECEIVVVKGVGDYHGDKINWFIP